MEIRDYIFLEGNSYLAYAIPIKVALSFRAFLSTNCSITADLTFMKFDSLEFTLTVFIRSNYG